MKKKVESELSIEEELFRKLVLNCKEIFDLIPEDLKSVVLSAL